ncbi:MAG: hypothetical protein K5750_02720 [Eubacterium sp.]|nr:hypothetical protein [Eubacterium sp.]
MRCIHCGNEIPAGAPACPVCGSPAMPAQQQQYQAPPQQQYNQAPQGFPGPQNFGGPQGQYQQPYGNPYPPKPAVYYYAGGPFSQRIRGDYTMLFSLVGAFFTLLFACIPAWISESVTGGNSESYGLFAEGLNGFVKFCGVMTIVVSVWLLFRYLVVFNIIPGVNLTGLTRLPGSEFYAPVVLLILFFVETFNGDIQDAFKLAKQYSGLSVHFNVSWWFSLAGIIFLFIRPVVCLIKGQNFHTGERKVRQAPQAYAYQRPQQQFAQPINPQAPYGQPQQPYGQAPQQAPYGQPQQPYGQAPQAAPQQPYGQAPQQPPQNPQQPM